MYIKTTKHTNIMHYSHYSQVQRAIFQSNIIDHLRLHVYDKTSFYSQHSRLQLLLLHPYNSSHLRCTGVKGTGFTNADLISVLGICGRDWMSMSSNISLFHANKKQFLLRFDIYGAAVQKEEAACLNVQKRREKKRRENN